MNDASSAKMGNRSRTKKLPDGNGPSKMTGSKFIAETIKGYGITHIFHMETVLLKTLVELEALGVKRILTHGEKAAAYMADGYARARRGPAICMAQSVGAANMAAGLQDPYLGNSPVISITGRKPPMDQHRNAYQEILHGSMFDPVTKFNACVETTEQLPHLLRQAFREATSGCPGPVHLDMIGHQAQVTEEGTADLEIAIEAPYTHYPPFRPEPEESLLKKAAALLQKSKCPVMIAGGGATASSAGPEIVKLAEMLSIPVATSLNGKECIMDSHPMSIGVPGRYSRWCTNQIISGADLVFYVGSGTGDTMTNSWTVPKPGTAIIQIDIDPSELGRNYANTLGILGDAKVALQGLMKWIKPRKTPSPWSVNAQKILKKWRAEVAPLMNSDKVPIQPERLCKELTAVLPRNAILVADTGCSSIWTGTMVFLNHPGQRYIRCAGSLGWGLPGSLGVKCAAPDRPVICFTGDGGLWYHLSELETARRFGIKTLTVVNNNHGLVQCVAPVERSYGNRPGKSSELWAYRDTNFARIAEEMGCLGIRVERPGDIAGALKKALASDLPSVVEVITDAECNIPDAKRGL